MPDVSRLAGSAVSAVQVSEPALRFLLDEAKRDVARMFEAFSPHYCKACGLRVDPCEQAAHVREHRRARELASRRRRRQALRALEQANRLRREASSAGASR